MKSISKTVGLKGLLKKREKAPKPRWEVYGLGASGGLGDDAPRFLVRPLMGEIVKDVEEQSVDKENPYRTERRDGFRNQRVKNLDMAAYARNLVKGVVAGWDRVTVATLNRIVAADYLIEAEGIAPSTLVAFSEESLDELSKVCSAGFAQWLVEVASDPEAIHAGDRTSPEEEKAEAENFPGPRSVVADPGVDGGSLPTAQAG